MVCWRSVNKAQRSPSSSSSSRFCLQAHHDRLGTICLHSCQYCNRPAAVCSAFWPFMYRWKPILLRWFHSRSSLAAPEPIPVDDLLHYRHAVMNAGDVAAHKQIIK